MRIDLVLLAIATLAAADSYACGPEFLPRLLNNRNEVLFGLQQGIFEDEAGRIIALDAQHQNPDRHPFADFERCKDRACSFAKAGEEERNLYQKGAALYAKGPREALAFFRQVRALPTDAQKRLGTWAQYMIAEITHKPSDYQMVRSLRRQGFADDQDLALASFGREAWYLSPDPTAVFLTPQNPSAVSPARIELYALAAAHGHEGARLSLLFEARRLLKSQKPELTKIEAELLAIYLFTYDHEARPEDITAALDRLVQKTDVKFADKLTASLYRNGRFADAERIFAAAKPTALAAHLRAKFLLRKGETEAAKTWFQKAERMAPTPRLKSERCILAAADNDFAHAAELARDGENIEDWLHLMERVLTIDEVRAHFAKYPPTDDQRRILGRRLLRAKGYEAGLAIIPEARPYVELIRAAQKERGIERAEILYKASKIARYSGMEIFGTELAPDWRRGGGAYDQTTAVKTSKWQSAAEIERVQASAPPFGVRYHYRRFAAGLAERAADDLPPRSHAYAAVLCWAAAYDKSRENIDRVYKRYINNGALVDFEFGRDCPEPNFKTAYRLKKTWWKTTKAFAKANSQRLWLARKSPKLYLLLAAIAGALLALFLALKKVQLRR